VSLRFGCAIFGAFLLVAQGLSAQGTGSTSGGSATTTTSTGGGPGGPATSCTAPTRQISLHIPDESAPPDGIVQMKLLVTEPTPVSSGGPRVPVPSGSIPRGIQLFNPNGDVNGVAMVGPQMVTIASIASSGTQGSDYPIMIMSLQLAPALSVGTKLPFTLDPSSTWTLGLLGTATLKPFPPATITVGGSLSITDVVPGGGIQPAGTVISVQGIGFQSGTQVQLSNIKTSSITVISPQEIQIVLAEPTQMTGKKIQATNPDGSNDTYFSYMRGIPLGQSEQPLLASALPIFSSLTHSQAVFSSGDAGAGEFTGIAVQNPNLAPATVTFNLFSVSHDALGGSTIVIPSGYRMMRDMSEVTGVAPPPGSYLVISSDAPVQMFGFLGDDAAGTVVPYFALASQP
jgi:hypothetical protein